MVVRYLGISLAGLRPALSLSYLTCRTVSLSLASGIAARVGRLHLSDPDQPPALPAKQAPAGLGYPRAIEAYEQLIDTLCDEDPA